MIEGMIAMYPQHATLMARMFLNLKRGSGDVSTSAIFSATEGHGNEEGRSLNGAEEGTLPDIDGNWTGAGLVSAYGA